MPYVGGSLVSLFDDDAQAATALAARRIAQRGAERWQEVTVENTPIDKGNLRSSWYVLPVQKTAHMFGPAYQTGIASEVDYAPHVEYGTGLWGPSGSKYEIKPKNPDGFLRWRDPETGEYVYAKRVMHPGSPGQHMVAIGGETLRHEALHGLQVKPHPLFGDIFAEWVQAIERGAD